MIPYNCRKAAGKIIGYGRKGHAESVKVKNMTRKKFMRLRRELVIRINRKYNGQPIGKAMYQCRDIRPTIHNYEGYAGVWESLKPARDLVGM